MTCPQATQPIPGSCAALVVLDAEAHIRFSFWAGDEGNAAKELLCREDGAGLHTHFRDMIRDLIDEPPNSGRSIVLGDGGRTLRLLPLAGSEGTLFGLVMEAARDEGAIARAAARYRLTPRQTEVLELILCGASAGDIAQALIISEYTAQGYVKSLLGKISARNRAALVAKVLDWKQAQ